MNRANRLALLVALMAAVGAIYVASTFIHGQEPVVKIVEVESAKPKMTTIVVAMEPLVYGTVLSQKHLKEVPWPQDTIPEGAFRHIKELQLDGLPRAVLTKISSNEPITHAKVTKPGERLSLSVTLNDGMRAVAISVNDVNGVAGFVEPNDWVDILMSRFTPDDRAVSNDNSYTDLLLQKVRILGVGQMSGRARNRNDAAAKTVTVEVSVIGAQKLALAAKIGHLSLALRNPRKRSVVASQRISLDDLSDVKQELVGHLLEPSSAVVLPKNETVQVVVIRGTDSVSYEVPRQ